MADGPDIFLSSPLLNFTDIRERIRAIAPERFHETIGTRETPGDDGVSAFDIVDTCVAQIRSSNLFICVLRDRYGTSLFAQPNEAEETESVSYLETEIVQATLFHSNVHFFLMEPFDPSPKLKGLLNLVETMRPGVVPKRTLSETDVRNQIGRLIHRTPRRKPFWTSLTQRDLVRGMEAGRGLPSHDIEFLNKEFRPVSKRPDLDRVRSLLRDSEDDQSTEKRLSRAWIALRELFSAPYDQPEFSEYLPHWDRALGAWSSAAAWYGLHGHLYAGRLAAINSQLAIRARLPNVTVSGSDERRFHGTKGARASEYYSIARLLSGKKQAEYYRLAELDIEDELRSGTDAPRGYLTIRGHIRIRQGNPKLALSDFEEAMNVDLKRDNATIAESLADRGFAHMELGNINVAVALLEESVQRFILAGSIAFSIRAKKRLALAYLKSLQPNKAARELNEAYDLADAHQVYDQIAPVMELMHRISQVTGWWRSSH